MDGRAYYTFVTLLRRLGLHFSVHLPWEVPGDDTGLILTTRGEAALVRRAEEKEGKGEGRDRIAYIFYEDLTGDDVIDGAIVLSSLSRGKEELLVGIDPGYRIGVVVHYRGILVHSGTCSRAEDVASLLGRLLGLRARRRVVKLGFGNPRMAYRIIEEAEGVLRNYVVELVDERGTSAEAAPKSRRDVEAALRISRRRGREVSV